MQFTLPSITGNGTITSSLHDDIKSNNKRLDQISLGKNQAVKSDSEMRGIIVFAPVSYLKQSGVGMLSDGQWLPSLRDGQSAVFLILGGVVLLVCPSLDVGPKPCMKTAPKILRVRDFTQYEAL